MVKKNKKMGRCKQFLIWLFTGRRLLISDDNKLICPRCMCKMDKVVKHKVTIDVCPFCNGLWLDDGEVEHLIKIANNSNKVEKIKKVSKGKKVRKSN